MIVEFIGSTGAGKTTLISAVQRRLAQTAKVSTAYEVVATPLGLNHVTHPTAQNLIQEIAGLPFFIRSLPRYNGFLVFALEMLARHGKFTRYTISYLRCIERTLGVNEIIRRGGKDSIVLVDEGTMLSAHSLFIYTDATYTSMEISKFASLVPLPDIIVYITAPLEDLIRRTLQRTDPPREMESRNPALVENYVKRAVAMFEQLVNVETIRSHVLVVENPEAGEQGFDNTIDSVIEFIQHQMPVGARTPRPDRRPSLKPVEKC